MAREQLNSYYALTSNIQTRILERPLGWTWQNETDIRQALEIVPSAAEKSRLRELLLQTLNGFDLRQNSIVATGIDPYGLAWSADGRYLVVGENVTRTLHNGDEAYVLYVLGSWPKRKLKEILLPAIEPDKIAAGFVEGIRALQFLPDKYDLNHRPFFRKFVKRDLTPFIHPLADQLRLCSRGGEADDQTFLTAQAKSRNDCRCRLRLTPCVRHLLHARRQLSIR